MTSDTIEKITSRKQISEQDVKDDFMPNQQGAH
jgi:hypothetical protein